MAEFVRRVYEKGKITIPKELRGLMGIEEGDYVRLEIVEVVSGDGKRRKVLVEEALPTEAAKPRVAPPAPMRRD